MPLEQLLEFAAEINPFTHMYNRHKEDQSRDEERQRIADARDDQSKYAEMQRDQMRNNIRIGQEYGLDPLAVIGSNQGSVSAGSIGATPMPPVLSESTRTLSDKKLAALQYEMYELQKDGLILDNLKKSQDLTPIYNVGTTDAIKPVNKLPIDNKLGVDPSGSTYVTYATLPDGGMVPVPSKEIKELIEDSPQELEHYTRIMGHNYLGSNVYRPKEGYEFSLSRNAWYPAVKEQTTASQQSGLSGLFNKLRKSKNLPKNFDTTVNKPLGSRLRASNFRAGFNPNNDYDYKKHGFWRYKKGFWFLERR